MYSLLPSHSLVTVKSMELKILHCFSLHILPRSPIFLSFQTIIDFFLWGFLNFHPCQFILTCCPHKSFKPNLTTSFDPQPCKIAVGSKNFLFRN